MWNTQGSRVLRGNLLIIPMYESILYVEPIYIQAENEESAIPELRRVVVGYKENVAWGASLDEALINMFGKRLQVALTQDRSDTEISEAVSAPKSVSISTLAEQARDQFEAAQAAQRTGNWADYGRYLNLLEATLKQLEVDAQ